MTTPWWQLEWLWTTTGWMLLGVGAMLLWWALLRDRSRGRRRCPKCWYDMTGVPRREETGEGAFICPECGRRIAYERGLHRTRRGWIRAGLAIPLLLCGYAALNFLAYRDGGWVRAVPSTVLAAMAEDYDVLPTMKWSSLGLGTPLVTAPTLSWKEELGNEAWRRLRAGKMWRWQSRWFLGRAAKGDTGMAQLRAIVPRRWPTTDVIPVLVDQRYAMWRGLWVVPQSETKFEKGSQSRPLPGVESSGRMQRDVRIKLALMGDDRREVYGLEVWQSMEELPDRASFFRTDATETMTAMVREAMDVRLWRSPKGAFCVLVNSHVMGDVWAFLPHELGCTVEVRLAEEPVGTGTYRVRPSWKVGNRWDVLQIKWRAGMEERARTAPELVSVVVKGDIGESFEICRQWPFGDLVPVCWTGVFETVPRVVETPEKLDAPSPK